MSIYIYDGEISDAVGHGIDLIRVRDIPLHIVAYVKPRSAKHGIHSSVFCILKRTNIVGHSKYYFSVNRSAMPPSSAPGRLEVPT
jgi:hypothetical protein